MNFKRILKRILNLKPGQLFYPFKGHRLPKIYRPKTGKKIHVRIRDPYRFEKFRVVDPGREGHSEFRYAYDEDSNRWVIQSWLFDLNDLKRNKKTQKILYNLLKEVRDRL